MAAGLWVLTDNARTHILDGTLKSGDTYKMALFQSTSDISASSDAYSGVSDEVANGDGYTTGGESITLALSGTTSVTLDCQADPTWTGSGSGFSARYAAIYEVSGNILCFCLLDDTPADITVADDQVLTIAINVSGILSLS